MSKDRENNKAGWSKEVLLCCSDVAHILNISRSNAYMLVQSGDLKSVRIGSSVRVRPSDLEEFIVARLTGGTEKSN